MGYFESGISKAKLGDHKGAIADYTMGIDFCTIFRKYLAYYNRGISRAEVGDYEGALSDFDFAIETGPPIALEYLNRGVSRAVIGELNKAIADYTKAIELDPKLAWAYLYRGIARTRLGKKKDGNVDIKLAKVFGDERVKLAIIDFYHKPHLFQKQYFKPSLFSQYFENI